MTDPTEFLAARLAEDEAAANACDMWPAPWSMRPNGYSQTVWSSKPGVSSVAVCQWSKTARHIVRWDPARVLAEVATKRRILAEHAPVPLAPKFHPEVVACARCGTVGEYEVDWPCDTVLSLTLPYAGHPDFDPAWRTA
jgi:hypothetical protein